MVSRHRMLRQSTILFIEFSLRAKVKAPSEILAIVAASACGKLRYLLCIASVLKHP